MHPNISTGMSIGAVTAILGLMGTAGSPALADEVSDFYKGKRMTLFIGSAPGGGYDRYGRLMSRHINRHVPGQPSIVVKNMPGASGLILAGHMYAKANRDGREIAGLHNTVVTQEIFDRGQRYKSVEFNWLGSVNQLTTTCIATQNAKVKSWPDAKKMRFVVGGTGADTSSTNLVPAFLKTLTDAQIKIIKGYPSTTSVILAMERNEVDGLCGIGWDSLKAQAFNLIRDKKINIIIQVAAKKHPELKGVPFVMDMAKSQDDVRVLEFLVARQYMGRPYIAPPKVPAARVAALRAAFDATMKDPKFQADAKKVRTPLSPIDGQEVSRHIKSLFATPPSVIARANEATKLQKGDVSKVKLKWLEAKGVKIDGIKKRNVLFMDNGKKVSASSRGAKIFVGGKKVKRKALKAGMKCDITYLGDGDSAKTIRCAN
ncbi:MAG: tripartite tricarboxylate transporter substrate-binding protein [Alphaproteobacteria bacterium]|nr:tripartite tricarboxylate transporter substrate-binding protein [Alphaproteobacteria bacterium]